VGRSSAGSRRSLRRIRATDPTSATLILSPVALACAARETLHLGDVVEDMLRKAMTVLMTNAASSLLRCRACTTSSIAWMR
jgi:Na+/phosphate symporter